MTIFLLISVALLPLAVFSLRYIAYLAIFFSGFTATVVLNLSNTKGISVFLFFAAVLTMLSGLVKLAQFIRHDPLLIRPSQLVLLQFLLVVFISSFMPLIIDGAIKVPSNLAFEEDFDIPIAFSLNSFLKIMPLMVGVCLSVCIISLLQTREYLYFGIKILLSSIFFVSLWGFMQYCSITFGFEYPDYIFNNIASETARGFSQVLGAYSDVSIYRLSSVTHEPLVFSKYLLIGVPILLFAIKSKQYYFSQILDTSLLIFVCFLIVAATSSTGVVGMVFSFVICQYFSAKYIKRKNTFFNLLSIIVLIISLIGLLFLFVPTFSSYLDLVLINKLSSGSGIERVASVVNSLEYIWANPSFGLGWNMMTINDLVINLIVNSGFLGLLSFIFMVVYLIKKSMFRNGSYQVTADSLGDSMRLGISVAFLVHITLGLFTGVEFYLGYFYTLLGLVGAAGLVQVSPSLDNTHIVK